MHKAPDCGTVRGFGMRCRRRPTLPRPLGRSTIGAVGLNDRVRDGNGCGPYALVASEFGWFGCQIVPATRRSTVVRRDMHGSMRRRASRSAGSGPTISCELTSDDGRSWTTNPTNNVRFLLAVTSQKGVVKPHGRLGPLRSEHVAMRPRAAY